MAHLEQGHFFEKCMEHFPHVFFNSKSKVIDFGSLDINGGPHLKITAKYIGVDLGEGPNVNLVCPSQEVGLESKSFDAAISSECLEHNPFWKETLFQMARLTREGGLVVWTCAGIGRAIHGTSNAADGGISAPFVASSSDYYKNVDARSASRAINHEGWYEDFIFFENFKSWDTYFVGIRKGCSSQDFESFQILKKDLVDNFDDVTKFKFRRFLYNIGCVNLVEKYFDFFRFVKVVVHADSKFDRIIKKLKKWSKILRYQLSDH